MSAWHKLRNILARPFYRRLAFGLGGGYLILFLIALQDLSFSGQGVQVLTTEWTRMFDRTGTMTFEPVLQLTLPGLTFLFSPLNVLIGGALSILAGLNLAVTYLAYKHPGACRFNRSTGIVASLPALLAGGACCAPAVVLIFGLQMSSLFITAFQVLLPVAGVLLVGTLKLILDRTNTNALAA